MGSGMSSSRITTNDDNYRIHPDIIIYKQVHTTDTTNLTEDQTKHLEDMKLVVIYAQ